jgi:exopolysaccharide production protein ExoQ
MAQNFQNHARFVPAYHFFALPIFLINFVWHIVQVFRHLSFGSVMACLTAAALVVLAWRRKRLWTVLRVNGPILLFFSYCGLSILWSDFPEVAFKRWIKAIGDLAMVLVVLTDPDWSAAIKRVLARASFLLIPLSVLFIKYYPSLGRGYHPWVWTPYYTGVTTNKNELGYICLIFGIASVWRWLQAFRQKQEKRRTAALAAYSVLLAMVLWLFWMAQSLTSLACFLMASGLMIATSLSPRARRPWAVHSMVGAVLLVSSLALFGDVGGLLQALGRDPTLTGRTEIWNVVLGLTGNSWIGTGYESFWLGARLERIWSLYWWHPRQAHNGYIEIFLNLGWVGVTLLAFLLIMGYRNVVAGLRRNPDTGPLRLAYFVAALAFNCTEAAFKMMHPVWLVFLLAVAAVPANPRTVAKKTKAAVAFHSFAREPVPSLEES